MGSDKKGKGGGVKKWMEQSGTYCFGRLPLGASFYNAIPIGPGLLS